MMRFVGKYGVQDQVLKDKAIELHLIPVFEEAQVSIYSNEKDIRQNYHRARGVHLILDGIVCSMGSFGRADDKGLDTKTQLRRVIEIYLEHGKDTLDLLDGSFSAVLWDSANRTLQVCRDDGGAKLIYYNLNNYGLYFSNSLELLVKFCGKPPISSRGLNEYLRFLDISPPYTIYENVFLLEPDKKISVEASGFRIIGKKQEKQAIPKISKDNLDINAKSFKQLFVESVQSRIGIREHVGTFLSGGIDSSLVCATAASIRNDITAYTVGFHDPRFDESSVAEKVARHLGVKHEILKFTPEQDFDAFMEFTGKVPSPFADPAIIPTLQCFKHVSLLEDLMVDGTGADTLIGVMPARHVRFILGFTRHIPARLRFLIGKLLTLNEKTAMRRDLFDYYDAAEVMIRWKGWRREEITDLRKSECDLSHTMFYRIYHTNLDKTPFELYSMLMGALPDERIHFCSSIYGPDVVFPFFDRKVQAYVKRLPLSHRYSDGTSKVLFRALLGQYVPQEIWDVPKRGFNFPFGNLLRFNNCELIHLYLSDRSLARHGFFDKSTLAPYIERFLNGDSEVDFKIWGLVMFQAWYENYYEDL